MTFKFRPITLELTLHLNKTGFSIFKVLSVILLCMSNIMTSQNWLTGVVYGFYVQIEELCRILILFFPLPSCLVFCMFYFPLSPHILTLWQKHLDLGDWCQVCWSYLGYVDNCAIMAKALNLLAKNYSL